MTDQVIVKDRDVLGGVAVFRATRVPFQTLLDYLEGGQNLDEFLDDFPTVSREAAIAACFRRVTNSPRLTPLPQRTAPPPGCPLSLHNPAGCSKTPCRTVSSEYDCPARRTCRGRAASGLAGQSPASARSPRSPPDTRRTHCLRPRQSP